MGQNLSWEGYIVPLLIKKFLAFHGTHNVTAAFKIATGPRPKPDNSVHARSV